VLCSFAVGCAPTVITSDGGVPTTSAATKELSVPDSTAPSDAESAIPKQQIGVGVLEGDLKTAFFKVSDSVNGEELLGDKSLSYITITPDTLLPKYYDRLGEIDFPRTLVRGAEIFVLKLESKEIDFDSARSIEELKRAVASAFGFATYYDNLVCESYYLTRDDSSSMLRVGDDLTNETEWDILQTNVEATIFLKFYNTAYGLRIVDPWYEQGLWINSDGEASAWATGSENGINGSDKYTKLRESIPIDEQPIRAMPLLNAIKIADSTRTENRDLSKAELVYICVPEAFGDEDYHLCWAVTTRYTTYYINCETGARWVNTNSED
jgi:hypothetical protein